MSLAAARIPCLCLLALLLVATALATAEQTLFIDLPECATPDARPQTGRYTRIRVRSSSGTLAGARVAVLTKSLFSTHLETLGVTDGDGTIGWTPKASGQATISADAEILEDPEGQRIPRSLHGQTAFQVDLGHEDQQTLLHIAIAVIAVLVIGLGAYLARRMFKSSTPAR